MTHANPHFAAHPPQPNDPPRPRPIGKPTPPPSGLFGLDLDGELTAQEETEKFLRLLPWCGIHGQPFRPRLSRAQCLEAEAKIFLCR
ncbi:MAG: hypothetical protein GXY15_07705 [Candidatus Hydrogenedentes bacterium]|nr:hypothetical protein [Candidatus Hydrogenedentota bacterium]